MSQCELTQVGGLLDNKGYGIGLPPSEYLVSSNFFLCHKEATTFFDAEFNLSYLIYLYLRFPLSDTYDQRNSSAARGWKIASSEGEMVETNEGRGAV